MTTTKKELWDDFKLLVEKIGEEVLILEEHLQDSIEVWGEFSSQSATRRGKIISLQNVQISIMDLLIKHHPDKDNEIESVNPS